MKLNTIIMTVALLFGLLVPSEAWAICMSETAVAMDDFMVTVDSAESAFRNVEEVEFMRLSGEVQNTVECVQQGFTLKQAARVHRLLAMRCFASGDIPCTQAEFRAARERDADHSFEQMGLGTGHPLQTHFDQSSNVDPGSVFTPVVNGGGHHLVDGVRGAVWYQGLPAILQHYCVPTGTDEAILCETTYLRAGQDLPAWAVALELPPAPVVRRGGLMTKPWFYYATSGALAAAAGGTYMASNSARNSYEDPSTPSGDLSGLESRTNGLGTTSVILIGAASVALVPAITFQFGGKKGDEPSTELTYNR